MSGHSKWSQIKHKKALTDEKRGKLFTKLLMAVQTAAKDDPNPDFNPRLRTAVLKAKEGNVPQENIERAISRAKDSVSEDLLIEAYGPSGVALIIKALTDSRNRTVAEIKKLLADNNAKFAEQGSVRWAFNQDEEGNFVPQFRQSVSETDKEKVGALVDELQERDDVMEIYTNAETE
ncbi:MAG: YebC/PmpR family DNA-binding transcriptional regulator [Parcubacteria group bacterium]